MVVIPAGWFEMGSSRGDPDEAPVHRVWVDSFLMDTCEVTQDQYTALAVVNPSHFKGPDLPVEQIAWAKAALFCNQRSEAEGLRPCYDEETAACNFEADGYRLPTEAEWEYACRAGAGPDGDRQRAGHLQDVGWFGENAAKTTTLWCRKGRTPGASTTCWATSRNGATTFTTRRPIRRAPTRIRGDRTRGDCAFFVAGRGIRRPQAAGRLPARRKAPASRTPVLPGTPLASAACAGRRRPAIRESRAERTVPAPCPCRTAHPLRRPAIARTSAAAGRQSLMLGVLRRVSRHPFPVRR